MIHKLGQADHAPLFRFLSRNPSFNLFIIGDIETFGYDVPFQDIWAERDEIGEVTSVLFRFYGNYIAVLDDASDAAGYARIVAADAAWEAIQGEASSAARLATQLGLVGCRSLHFAEMVNADSLDPSLSVDHVKKATPADVDRILDVRAAGLRAPTPADRESLLQVLEKNAARTFYVEDESGRMVAAASTTAENSLSAMVVGVCTRLEYRRRGFATACMTALARELLAEGRKLCLFYDNPEAGRIYNRIGFREIGKWDMYQHVRDA